MLNLSYSQNTILSDSLHLQRIYEFINWELLNSRCFNLPCNKYNLFYMPISFPEEYLYKKSIVKEENYHYHKIICVIPIEFESFVFDELKDIFGNIDTVHLLKQSLSDRIKWDRKQLIKIPLFKKGVIFRKFLVNTSLEPFYLNKTIYYSYPLFLKDDKGVVILKSYRRGKKSSVGILIYEKSTNGWNLRKIINPKNAIFRINEKNGGKN